MIVSLLALSAGCGSAPDETTGSNSPAESHSEPKIETPAEHAEGEEVYTQKCALCHDHGEAGSPRIGVPVKWAKRIAKGEDVLTKNAFEGFEGKWGEMPPQGDDLSEEQVASAVRYMIFRYEAVATTE